jgi:hypothetical protein
MDMMSVFGSLTKVCRMFAVGLVRTIQVLTQFILGFGGKIRAGHGRLVTSRGHS